MKRALMISTILAGLAGVGVAAAGTAPGTSAIQAPVATASQDAAFDPSTTASRAEDLMDFAMAGDRGRATDKLNELRADLPKLRSALGETAADTVERHLAAIEEGLAKADLTAAALAADETFRTIVEAQGGSGGLPIEVSLLDYSGFKLKALALAKQPDWPAIQAALSEATGFWERIATRVPQGGLRDLIYNLEAGIAEGAKQQDTSQVAFGAQILLDAVDLLEKDLAPK